VHHLCLVSLSTRKLSLLESATHNHVVPTDAPKGHVLPKTTNIEDKDQEVEPFRPQSYCTWLTIALAIPLIAARQSESSRRTYRCSNSAQTRCVKGSLWGNLRQTQRCVQTRAQPIARRAERARAGALLRTLPALGPNFLKYNSY